VCDAIAISTPCRQAEPQLLRGPRFELGIFATKPAHGVTSVATFILLTHIGDERLWTLHFNLEGGDQRVFSVNDNVSCFTLTFKANRKLHLGRLPFQQKLAQFDGGVRTKFA
jgi:hypothetical protein